MDYISLEHFQHYKECAKIALDLGFFLVELKMTPQKNVVRVQAVVSSTDATKTVSVDDCARVHRAILSHLEETLSRDDIAMELSSPGMERNIKNAAEFTFFVGKNIRVWSRAESDWISGELLEADSKKIALKVPSKTGEIEKKQIELEDIAKAKFVSS